MSASREPEWGYRLDGKPRTFGDLSRPEQAEVLKNAFAKLQAEANDPNSRFSRTCRAILHGPEVPRTKQ